MTKKKSILFDESCFINSICDLFYTFDFYQITKIFEKVMSFLFFCFWLRNFMNILPLLYYDKYRIAFLPWTKTWQSVDKYKCECSNRNEVYWQTTFILFLDENLFEFRSVMIFVIQKGTSYNRHLQALNIYPAAFIRNLSKVEPMRSIMESSQ